MEERTKCRGRRYLTRKAIPWCPAMLLVASLLGCGGARRFGPVTASSPSSGCHCECHTLFGHRAARGEQTFSATVANTDNTTVTWTVNGIAGGNPAVGTINASGVYTAPGILPPPGSISIVATSAADPSKTASASVLLSSDLSVSISPLQSSVELGASKAFAATVTSAGKPNPPHLGRFRQWMCRSLLRDSGYQRKLHGASGSSRRHGHFPHGHQHRRSVEKRGRAHHYHQYVHRAGCGARHGLYANGGQLHGDGGSRGQFESTAA